MTGTAFDSTDLSKEQLYSTASYRAKNLRGIRLGSKDLRGWDFSEQDLRNANFATCWFECRASDLSGANRRVLW